MKKGKKFIVLLLILSLIEINCATLQSLSQKRESRRKKRGANLIIQKINGQQIWGELITIKPSSLLLLDAGGKDVSVDIADIKVITVVKKSQALLGVGTGLLGGAGSGAAIGASLWVLGLPVMAIFGEAGIENWKDDFQGFLRNGALIGIGVGVLLGAIVGGTAGTDKTIQLEGKSDSEIKKAMDKLRKKARIRDYK
ncbi:hypothetical protein ES703_113771 [subsurface metagenome]